MVAAAHRVAVQVASQALRRRLRRGPLGSSLLQHATCGHSERVAFVAYLSFIATFAVATAGQKLFAPNTGVLREAVRRRKTGNPRADKHVEDWDE